LFHYVVEFLKRKGDNKTEEDKKPHSLDMFELIIKLSMLHPKLQKTKLSSSN